jgi:cellulose synthase/poly-beta-1,6-N-acetylglucosamine synthase-like glycosyltransferase
MEILAWCFAGLASLTLALTVLNRFGWPRGEAAGRLGAGGVSVLIPARNEEAHIEACVRAAFASEHPLLEVVVCDDHSTDKTPEILRNLQAEFSSLRVIQGRPLPEGLVGKPHACAQLAAASRGEVLLYVDADTVLSREGVGRLVSLLESMGASLVTAVPRQVTVSLAERVVLPLLHLTYTNWLPIPLVWRSRDPRFLAANGQLLAVRRAVYEEVGGF